jgi:hypothetical protein
MPAVGGVPALALFAGARVAGLPAKPTLEGQNAAHHQVAALSLRARASAKFGERQSVERAKPKFISGKSTLPRPRGGRPTEGQAFSAWRHAKQALLVARGVRHSRCCRRSCKG